MKYFKRLKCILEMKPHISPTNMCTLVKKCRFGTKTQSLIHDLYKTPGPQIPFPSPDINYLLSKVNRSDIISNLAKRTEISYEEASKLVEKIHQIKEELQKTPTQENRKKLVKLASTFPNLTHPNVIDIKEPKVLKERQWEPKSSLEVIHPFDKLSKMIGGVRTRDTAQVSSERNYYLFGQFAELEQALIR